MLLLKPISQIQCSLFDYFHPLYYNVIPLGNVEVKVYCNHSVKYTTHRLEQHTSNNNILC